jgi:hypothetical protein
LDDEPMPPEPAGSEVPPGAPAKAPKFDPALVLPWITLILGFLLFAALTITYVTWSVNAAQHRWCDTIELLNSAPPPAPVPSGQPRSPAREYDQKLAQDFHVLKGRLGC